MDCRSGPAGQPRARQGGAHHYQVDSNGLIEKLNLLIATSQDNLAMNLAVEQTARCFDPCLSCSTHAAGRMPLMVELRDSGGELLQRVER